MCSLDEAWSPTLETWVKFLAPDYSLTMSLLLLTFGEVSFSLLLSKKKKFILAQVINAKSSILLVPILR